MHVSCWSDARVSWDWASLPSPAQVWETYMHNLHRYICTPQFSVKTCSVPFPQKTSLTLTTMSILTAQTEHE
jgi:hypothetical protein